MAYVDVICTACAGKISLHEGMKFGYCTLCGSRISLADAKAGKIDPQTLKNLSADDLFKLAVEADEDSNLMMMAANKGSGEANAVIASQYTQNGEYSESLPYWKKAADKGIADGKAGYATMLLRVNNDPDEYPLIIKLAEEALAGGCNESVGEVCKNVLETLRPMVKERKRREDMDRAYRRAKEACDYEAIKRLAEQGHPEAIDTVAYVQRKTVCRYYNNGICNYSTTASFLYHCSDSRNAACPDYRIQD